ncbi:AlpA family phage regulatory protein [Vreelandella janggokensis]|uniref:AlpA family phage regulatory protein n=1 Tax=Vreelandella janggokensis TaxID=370767 RepID=UPI003BF4B765
MLRIKQVKERTGLSRSTIYNKMDPSSPFHDPDFPRRVHLGRASVAWEENEIDEWLHKRMNLRD